MMILVTYDVNTDTAAGRGRLNRIAKECEKVGQRVQKSVFECSVDAAQKKLLIGRLLTIMDIKKDSIRIYNLGNSYQSRIEKYGKNETYDPSEVLIV